MSHDYAFLWTVQVKQLALRKQKKARPRNFHVFGNNGRMFEVYRYIIHECKNSKVIGSSYHGQIKH